MDSSIWDLFLASKFPTRIVSITTKSGRKFKFDITNFRIYPTTTETEIDEMANRIVEEKYRECLWDRNHPTVNSELEIRVSLIAFISDLVGDMRRYQEQCEAKGKSGPRTVGSGTTLTHTTNYSRRPSSRTRMRKVYAVFDNTGKRVRTFDLNSRQEALALAEELTRSQSKAHYVNEVKVPMTEEDE